MSGFFSHQSIGKALLWYECFSERILPSILAPLGLFFSKECCSLSFLSYMRHRHATTILTHTQYICNNCGKPHIDSTPATLEPKAESFYYVKYGSSIITSKILSNENKKTGVSRKIVCFGILIHVLSWRQQKHQCLCFHYWDFLTNFWRNNWRSIFDVVERLC